jgi:alkaline phosphatase
MKLLKLSIIAMAISALTACTLDGDKGPEGAQGAQGTPGAQGAAGLNSLTVQSNLAVSDSNCRNGGVQLQSGLDANANGTLDTSEVSQTNFVCSPSVNSVTSADVANNITNSWYQDGLVTLQQSRTNWLNNTQGRTVAAKGVERTARQSAEETIARLRGSAKNVILFVGDGMGISTVTAARILDGQDKGMMGEENALHFGEFPFAGLAKTYNVDAQTPDSAGTMTAMMTGVKTDVGTIGTDEDIVRGDCSTVEGNELVTALEQAELAGKATGVISTARITHATPAATYSKSADRNWEDNSDMPAEAVTAGCEDIASQLVNFESNLEARFPSATAVIDGIDVAMGGGRRHFLPKDAAFNSSDAASSVEGDRTDGRDLTAEWQAQYTAGSYVMDQAGFDAINPETTSKLFGLFNESHMQYEADRANDSAGEPSVAEMTEKAIQILDNDDDGFFLMVESGRIDHSHHAGNAHGALRDTIALAEAVKVADELTSDEDTLIIVTADHGHVFTIAGYPKRGNPILGKVVNVGATEADLASDELPYTTLGYTNGPGHRNYGATETNPDRTYGDAVNAGRIDLTDIDTTLAGFHQEALVPKTSETHSGEDIGVYAKGPGAFLVNGTNEQNMIYHIMAFAADLQ